MCIRDRSRTCSRGRDCRFSHDHQHFDDQGRVRQPSVGPQGKGGAKGAAQEGDAPAGLQAPPAGATGGDPVRN
eukprot:343751-Alexandrium_andersonii.AAC.1